MRSHDKNGCSGATSGRRGAPIVLLLLAIGAAVAWFVRSRHVAGIAEADAWRQELPEWSGPSGSAARRPEAGAPAAAPAAAMRPAPAPVPGAGSATAASPASAPAAGSAAAPAPAPAAAPAPPADDLRRIEGIGPKIAAALVAAELGSYAAVAEASDGDLRAALKDAGLRFAPSLGTWARQARLLADGDEAGFLALTDRLVAGRDEG